MSMPWLRLYTETVDDDKLRLLAFEDRWHFIAILCLKGSGLLDQPESELKQRRIAIKMGVQVPELDEIKRRLLEVGLIDADMQPVGWDKRQFKSDSDPTAKERKRRQRERQRINYKQDVTDVSRVTVTGVTRTDTETETEINDAHLESAFDEFWNHYPRKRDKKRARKYFMRLSAAEQDQAISDIKTRFADVPPEKREFIPYPTTYLNGERWNDEPDDEPSNNITYGQDGI